MKKYVLIFLISIALNNTYITPANSPSDFKIEKPELPLEENVAFLLNTTIELGDQLQIPILDSKQSKSDFQCKLCGKFYKQYSSLKRHESTHRGEKKHECDICHKFFNQKSHLKTHMKLHEENPIKFTCFICNKSFNQKGHLKEHLTNIHSMPCIKCIECNKDCIDADDLIQHQQKYHQPQYDNIQEPSFICSICGHFFNNWDLLLKHRNTHTPEQ